MFLLSRPTDDYVRTLLSVHQHGQFSYIELGATREAPPSGYRILHDRRLLGFGPQRFLRASEALSRWRMFEVPGVHLCWPSTPVEAGNTVAVLVKHFEFWSLNFCRIVYVIEEEKPLKRIGFAYGTLTEHAESGEERFTVEWDPATDRVTFDIFSFSRPRGWVTRVANPVARSLQRRFVACSLAAMARATDGP